MSPSDPVGRTWAGILQDAIGDRTISHIHELTIDDPEGPIQRATISNGLTGKSPRPSARTLRVLARVLGFDENAARAELAMPEARGEYRGGPKSEELTDHQRNLLDALIDQMVERNRAEAQIRGDSRADAALEGCH